VGDPPVGLSVDGALAPAMRAAGGSPPSALPRPFSSSRTDGCTSSGSLSGAVGSRRSRRTNAGSSPTDAAANMP
jgi:hypothetical protein